MTRLSLRGRLLIPLLVILLVGLAGAPLLASVVTRNHLEHRDENRLRAISRTIGGLLSGRDRVELSEARLARLPGAANVVVTYLDADGRIVYSVDRRGAAADPGGAGLDQLVRTGLRGPAGELTRIDQGGRTYRVIRTATPGLVVVDGPDEHAIAHIVLASDRSDDEEVVRTLERAGAAFAVVAMVVLGTLAAWTLHRGLRPLERMAGAAAAAAAEGRSGADEGFREAVHGGAPELTRLGDALAGAFAARARAEETVRSFMLDASHELRTPLTTLSGWLDLYAQGGLTDQAELDRALGRMESEVGRMRLLVDELDLLARMDRSRPLDLVDVPLAPLLTDLVDDVRVVDPGRGIGLEITGAPVVRADAKRLEQVVRNLLANAVQHTPPGTAIEVRATPLGERVRVDVVDHGPGIAEAELERIFERFHRSASARRGQGSGLGLAIVRALVQAHGGTVTASATPGGGATVAVELLLAETVSEPSGSP
ncbi:sensor histidine kinase [Cryptosporangium sp. NPDC051539]|uniref:sensor histidine kinase n=1 Tax=Cryptosporangium sp. NPDC051539 TaxID=3363962 RepID=UPI0037BBA977